MTRVTAGAILGLTALSAGCSSVSDPLAAARAFAAASGDAGRSVHIEVTGRITSPFGAAFTATYDLVGAEYVGSSILTSEATAPEQGLARIGDHTFSRYGDNGWALEDRPFGRPDPFAGITDEDLEVVGTDRRDDREVVHLRILEPEAALGVIALYGSHFLVTTRIDRLEFDLYVSADGVPIAADVDVQGSVEGELSGPVAAVFALRFSGWGATALVPPFTLAAFPPATTFVADNGFDEPIIVRDREGVELLVPSCSRVTTEAFDGSRIDVRYVRDDVPILSTEATAGRPHAYVYVSAVTTSVGEDLPYVEATRAPCTGRPS